MRINIFIIGLLVFITTHAQKVINVNDFGATADSFEDATESVNDAIEAARGEFNTVINFPKGRYDFWADEAKENIYYISNTSTEKEYPSNKQRAGLYLKGLKNVTIEGNNSTFVFHGKMISWILDNCDNITIKNVTVDYERPGMSEMTFEEVTPSYITCTIHPDSKFKIINGTLEWYGEKWIMNNHHAILVDTITGINSYSSWAPFKNSKAEVIAPFKVKFSGDFSNFVATPGQILTVRDTFRDYVGALVYESKNIALKNIRMQYMQGLGIVSQFSENLHYENVFVEPDPESGRVMSSSADGMHFSGCRGSIIVDSCRFKGMHDDPINIHGTHLKIVDIISPTTVKVRFMHGQTYGFPAFAEEDTVGFVNPFSLKVLGTSIVKKANLVSEREMIIDLKDPILRDVSEGDFLENISATPSVIITNSKFERTNTRGLLVTTRRKVLIENNTFFRTGMHAILIENDAQGWYESGPVRDVTIQNNIFDNCAYGSYPNNYVIQVSPQNREFIPKHWVHENIKIKNNTFKVYDYPILSAKSTSGLEFTNNRIITDSFLNRGERRAGLNFIHCTKVNVENNIIENEESPIIKTIGMKKRDIKSDI